MSDWLGEEFKRAEEFLDGLPPAARPVLTRGTADDRPVAEILAVLLRLPRRDRIDTLALATRAALDSGILDLPEGETP